MVQAPQVQSLEQIMSEVAPAFSKQSEIINTKKAGLSENAAADLAGLDAIKSQSMNTINTQATGRGMSFSGIPEDEQATYLSTQYLPGVANLRRSQVEAGTALDQQAADLFSKQYTTAYDTRNNQINQSNQWNMNQMQNEFNAGEAEKDRNFQLSRDATNRSYEQSQEPSLEENIRSFLDSYADPETGIVPKKAWQQAVQLAHESGLNFGGENGFANKFWGYADDANYTDYQIGYDKYLQ